MSRSVRLALLLLAAPAVAQEALPTLPEVLAGVQDTEVYIQGYIGTSQNGVVQFVLPGAAGTAYDVGFEGDAVETGLAGCNLPETPCRMDGYGYTTWDGPRLKLVISSFEKLDPPGKME